MTKATKATKAKTPKKPRRADPKKFMTKIVGDSGERVLHKASREIGKVIVVADRSSGYTVTVGSSGKSFQGEGKSLRSAIHKAVKLWAKDE